MHYFKSYLNHQTSVSSLIAVPVGSSVPKNCLSVSDHFCKPYPMVFGVVAKVGKDPCFAAPCMCGDNNTIGIFVLWSF